MSFLIYDDDDDTKSIDKLINFHKILCCLTQ